MKKLVFLFSLAIIGTAHAVGLEEGTLQGLSSSGKSLVLDRGVLEKYEEGMYARFFIQKGPKEFPKIFLVGEGELVKSFPRKSFWLMKKIYIPDALKENSKVLLMTSTQVTSGRPLRLKHRHVVLSDNDYSGVDDFIDKNQDNVPKRLVKEEDPFTPSEDIFEKSELKDDTPEADVVVSTYENFKSKGGTYFSDEYGDVTKQRYFLGNKQLVLGDIRRAEDKKLFDSMGDGYEKKVNGMRFGVKSFYNEQERIAEIPEIQKKSSEESTFDKVKKDQREADVVNPIATAKYKRDGEMWSADMDDVSLRRYFIKTGLEKEARRREIVLNELEAHEVLLHFSNALSSHGNTSDPNYQGRGYNLGISYDLHLARTSPSLKNWSLQFILESGVTEYDTGVYNARSEEVNYGAYVNYYFWNNPLTLNSFIWLGGVGIKNGSASVFSPDLSQEYSYQVLTIPALQIMTKYRFRSGDLNEDNVNIGASVNLGINLDMKNLSVIDRVNDNINSKISVSDLKYTIGFGVYF